MDVPLALKNIGIRQGAKGYKTKLIAIDLMIDVVTYVYWITCNSFRTLDKDNGDYNITFYAKVLQEASILILLI